MPGMVYRGGQTNTQNYILKGSWDGIKEAKCTSRFENGGKEEKKLSNAMEAKINTRVQQMVDMHADWSHLSDIIADHWHHRPDSQACHRDNYLRCLLRSRHLQDQQVMDPWLPIRRLWSRQRTQDPRAKAMNVQWQERSNKDVTTYGNAIPIFVNHHHAQEHAKSEEEQSIDIMLDGVANRHAESEEKNLGNSEKCCTKNNVTQGPTVIKRAEDENELWHDIDHSTNKRP